jgi:hypothetical protein
VDLDNVTNEDWIVGGVALAVAIFLVILPWFDAGSGLFSVSLSATSAPDGWLGILAFLASLSVAADLALERFAPHIQVPAIGGSRTNTRFILSVTTAAFVALKFLFHIHFTGIVSFAWGFYIDIIATAALVYVAYQARQGLPVVPGGMSTPSRRPPAPPSRPTETGGSGSGSGGGSSRRPGS